MFGDVNFHQQMSFDLQGPLAMPPATSSYDTSGLPASSYQDDSFDLSADQFTTHHGLPEFDPNALSSSADFTTLSGADTSFSRSVMPPPASKLDSPFTSNGPRLAPPPSSRQGPTTDSIHKNQPQTPRKVIKAKAPTAGRSSQSLLPAGMKTPLAQCDPNTRANKRNGPDSPTVDHTSPRKAAKRSKLDEPGRHRELVPIPDAEEFPEVDPGEDSAKPPYTYAQMIALAIWKGKERRRTLSQIYDFIRTTWSYYRKDDTWENSIRHNLSLHKKFFEKKAREKDDPGKGNYWLIIPGNERELLEVYLKERPGHDQTMQGKNIAVISTGRLEPSALPPPMPYHEPMLPPQIPHFQLQFPPMPESQTQTQAPAPLQPDRSSDATIPASDQAFDETDFADGPPNYNPLDTALTSSPPAISRRTSNHDTPTRSARMEASSGRTSGKRKRYSMGVDSGYMTGESSILRYGQRGGVFSSEGDPEFQGGGRAEDAIRKLRASSTDSPSKGRTLMLPPSSPLGKGSPLRYRASPSMMPAPSRTPANPKKVLAAAPILPPPKTTSKFNNSPIRQHNKLKDQIQSMLQTPEVIRDYGKKYPARRQPRIDFDSFAIWEDNTSGPEMESPLPANSAGRMLDELMSAKKNQKTPIIASSPYKSFPLFPQGDENTPWSYDSPCKVVAGSKLLSPSKFLPQTGKSVRFGPESWIADEGLENLDAEVDLGNLDSYEEPGALDLTQSFRSIGERPLGVEPFGPATLHQYG